MPKHGRGHRKRDTRGRTRKIAISGPAALREITVSAREIQNRGYRGVRFAAAAMSMNARTLGSQTGRPVAEPGPVRRSPACQLKGAPGNGLDAK